MTSTGTSAPSNNGAVPVLQVANIRKGMDVGLLLTGVPLVVLSRAVNIYPLAYLVNKGEPVGVT